MKQFKPAIVLILIFTVAVIGWTVHSETGRRNGPGHFGGAGAFMKTATAPPITMGQPAPHGDFGKCTNCHDIIGANGPKTQKVAATMLAATAPPIRPNQAAPHPDFGKCTNCHNMIPPPPPIRSFQSAPHPNWGPCTDCHDIIPKAGAQTVAATVLAASVAPPMGGVWLKPITAATADRLGLENVDGVLVSGVNEQSSAYQAGLRVGDIIQRVDNQKVDNINQALALISVKKLGETVKLQILHNGKQRKVHVQIVDSQGMGMAGVPGIAPGVPVAAAAPPGNRIAIAATGPDLSAQVAPVFSRAGAFILYDPATGRFTSMGNTGAASLTAGQQATEQLANAGVGAVIAGNVGPASMRRLQTSGIDVYTGAFGSVQTVTNQYLQGTLVKATSTTITVQPAAAAPAGSAKVAVATDSPSANAPVARDLGMARYLIIFDLTTGQAQAIEKTPAPDQGINAVQTAHLMVENGASAVIAGNMSPDSTRAMSALGIFSFSGITGTAQQAAQMYQNGTLRATTVPSAGAGNMAAGEQGLRI